MKVDVQILPATTYFQQNKSWSKNNSFGLANFHPASKNNNQKSNFCGSGGPEFPVQTPR